MQIREYISHCQNAEVENLIKAKESEKRSKSELDLNTADNDRLFQLQKTDIKRKFWERNQK